MNTVNSILINKKFIRYFYTYSNSLLFFKKKFFFIFILLIGGCYNSVSYVEEPPEFPYQVDATPLLDPNDSSKIIINIDKANILDYEYSWECTSGKLIAKLNNATFYAPSNTGDVFI